MPKRRNKVKQVWKAGEIVELNKLIEVMEAAYVEHVPFQPDYGMSEEQWRICYTAWKKAKYSPAMIAEAMGIPAASMAQALKAWDEKQEMERRRRREAK